MHPQKKLVKQTGAIPQDPMNEIVVAQMQAAIALPEVVGDLTEAVLSLVVCQKAIALALLHQQLELEASPVSRTEMTQELQKIREEVLGVETELVEGEEDEPEQEPA